MGAFGNYLNTIKAGLAGPIPFGGTLVGTSEGVPVIIAQQIRGGFMPLDTLDTLVDLPYELLAKDMEVIVSEYEQGSGAVHPRTRYYLRQMPPANTKVNEVGGYNFADYWVKVGQEDSFAGAIESQYAPNVDGKRPKFLPSEISSAAYQAGYPDDATYTGGNPADQIWTTDYEPALSHAWIRQRVVGTSTWGIPISLNAGGDYEQNQYIDTIFIWIPKGDPIPDRPIQPADYSVLPTGWENTPGPDYDTKILTEDLYRSQALKNPYGVLKSNWDTPILVSSDPALVRYGNTPGNTDFLNDLYWRGYYTPGLDTHQATRPTGASTDWTITKIDQESGEFPDFVFKNFDIGADPQDIIDATPTSAYPVGGAFPNDAYDAPPPAEENKILYMSKSVKYPDGSLKTPWSLWRRFDGLDTIQAVIEESPGDTFFLVRNSSGNLVHNIPAITLEAKIYKGPEELITGFNSVKWYRGATLIVFDSGTRKATNLGVSFNQYHTVSVDGKSLTINPEGIEVSQEYKAGVNHVTRPTADYEDTILLKDTTDDGAAFVADINSPNGSTFKNQTGLYRFVADFFKGGQLDITGVTFSWTIFDALGAVIIGGLRNNLGVTVGDEDYVGGEVYVQGSDIDQYATLKLVATFGQVIREDIISLTDVTDAEALEVLYWGYGATDPGNPTDFTPRTLTKQEVLDLAINYSTEATGAWYRIERVAGVWSGEIKMRSESARPNGGISLMIFKNVEFGVDGAPVAPAVPGSGSIIPAGWTNTPTAYTGGQDRTYATTCFFLLRTDVAADPTTLTRDNYTPSGTYGTPYVAGMSAPPPVTPGAPGANGWTPIIANVIDTQSIPGVSRVVEKIIDWIGGTGTKPAADTSTSYIGPAGLTTITNATDKKGTPGNDASSRPQAFFKKGTKRAVQPAQAFPYGGGLTGQYLLVSDVLTVQNTWSGDRVFIIQGEVPVSNSSGIDSWSVKLMSYGTLIDFSNTEDQNFSNMDHVNASPGYIHKIHVRAAVTIPAGETRNFYLTMAQVFGGASLYEKGLLEAFGI